MLRLAAILIAGVTHYPTHSCATHSSFYTRLQAQNTSCRVARDVMRYQDHHEILGPFRLDGQRWVSRYKIPSGSGDLIEFDSGTHAVYIQTREPVG